MATTSLPTRTYILIALLAIVSGCSDNKELSRDLAVEILRKSGEYPKEQISKLTSYTAKHSSYRRLSKENTEDVFQYAAVVNAEKYNDYAYVEIVDEPTLNRRGNPLGGNTVSASIHIKDKGQKFVRGEEKSYSYNSRKKYTPVVAYTVELADISGISFLDSAKRNAIVEFNETYEPTPFGLMIEELQSDSKKIRHKTQKKIFVLYDDGWRISTSR